MIDGTLLPRPDEDSAPFFEYAARGELRIQACVRCGRRRMPPRPMCAACGSFDSRWDLMSGRAHVWSVVVAHPPLLPAYDEQAPYNVVVVSLDDDPPIRLVGNVVAAEDSRLDSVDPHSIGIGDALEVVFAPPMGDEAGTIVLPRWRPA
jgi:uncharacterized OB-fold protein